MAWKKLLETKDLIAYEKATDKAKMRIEARYKKNRWRVYKTYNFNGKESINHVKEYIATSLDEAKQLLLELKQEPDISFDKIVSADSIKLDIVRCYKEEFVEKWKFKIDDFNEDNLIIIRFDSEVQLDVILHERYNYLEKSLLEKFIKILGLKDVSNKIKYEFFYFKRHSAKRRIYQDSLDKNLVAEVELNLGIKDL
jgi:hypothetical protein